MDAVIGSYGTIMAAQRGEVVCEVITAKVRNSHMVFINLHIVMKKLKIDLFTINDKIA